MAASAPAITGRHFFAENGWNLFNTGAVYRYINGLGSRGGTDNDNPIGAFDASRCSSIYGASNTIRPISKKVIFMIRY